MATWKPVIVRKKERKRSKNQEYWLKNKVKYGERKKASSRGGRFTLFNGISNEC